MIQDINRITVEFKFAGAVCIFCDICILIESQWNLNEDVRREQSRSRAILIESQWNLNRCLNYCVLSMKKY